MNEAYLLLLCQRDSRLSCALKDILRDEILVDVSDYGVDLAVGRVFIHYRPGTRRWKQLQYTNDGWLTCQTEATMSQPFQIVHINLINGALGVAGRMLRNILLKSCNSEAFQRICRDVRTCYNF